MNEALQTLEVKVENNGTTPQGKIFAREWNVLVEAVKALDLKEFDEAKLLQFLRDNYFITSEDIPDVDFSNVVTLSGQQTISGPKDFVGGIKVNGMPIIYNTELGVWEFTGDLFVTGNFAWGSSIDGFKPSTVMDAVRVDGSTIIKKKDSNGDWYLYAPGGGSGGSGGGLTLGDVASYLSDNDYTTKADVNSLIASSLVEYATQSWVGDNYLSKSGGTITGASGALTIARSDADQIGILFTGASGNLGFIGFSGSNTPAYIGHDGNAYPILHSDNYANYALPIKGGTITIDDIAGFSIYRNNGGYSAVHFYNTQDGNKIDVGYLGAASDGRPVYINAGGGVMDLIHSGNYSDYALPITGGTVNGNLSLSSTNAARSIRFDTSVGSSWLFVNSGEWYVTNIGWGAEYKLIHSGNIGQYAYIRNYGSIPNGEDLANLQAGSYWVYEDLGAASAVKLSYSSLVVLGNSYYSPQMNISHNAQQAYIRGVYNTSSGNSVSDWHELAFTDSNVASADVLKKSFANENINYGAGDGLKLIYCHSNPGNFASDWQSGISVLTDYTGWQLTCYGGDVENPYFRSLQDNGVWKPWRQLAFLDSDVLSPSSGLLTINGNAAISGILTMSDNTNPAICFGSYWYLQRINNTIALGLGYTNSLKVYDVGDVEVVGNIEGGIFGLRNSNPDNPLLRLTVGNQNYYVQATSDGIYLGPTSTLSLKVDANGNTTINGNLLVYGNVSWFSHSQRSLKNIISEQGLSLAQLERIRPIKFYWKDGRDMALHVGGVADVFAEVLPEVVTRNLQDILCLNYVDAAFYVGASLIAPVLDHERRITKGEAEQEALKKENAKLKRELEEVKSKLNHLAA